MSAVISLWGGGDRRRLSLLLMISQTWNWSLSSPIKNITWMSASDDQDQVSKTRVMYWELELNVALLICDCILMIFQSFAAPSWLNMKNRRAMIHLFYTFSKTWNLCFGHPIHITNVDGSGCCCYAIAWIRSSWPQLTLFKIPSNTIH